MSEKEVEKPAETGDAGVATAEARVGQPDDTFKSVEQARKDEADKNNPALQAERAVKEAAEGAVKSCCKEVGDGEAIGKSPVVKEHIKNGKTNEAIKITEKGELVFAPNKDQGLEKLVKGNGKDNAAEPANEAPLDGADRTNPNIAGDAQLATGPRKPHAGIGKPTDGRQPSTVPEGWGRQPEKVENIPETREGRVDTKDGVMANLDKRLSEIPGMSDAQRAQHKAQMEQYLGKMEQNLKNIGTPPGADVDGQMTRSYAALNEMLNPEKGLNGPLNTSFDRVNLALSSAGTVANPELANQDKANQCALTGILKTRISGNDPATSLEQTASVVNRGGAWTNSPDGDAKWVNLKPVTKGLEPARGATEMFNPEFHGGNKQSAFVQTMNQFTGEYMAQLDGPGNHYFAAGVNTRTGEGFFKNGEFQYMAPNSTLGNVARTLHGMGGSRQADGQFVGPKFLVHASMADQLIAKEGDADALKYAGVFSNEKEMHDRMNENLKLTGTRLNSGGVNAPYMKGEAEVGHGLHVINWVNNDSRNSDGSYQANTVGLLNNWGQDKNYASYSYSEIDKASNLDTQNAIRQQNGQPQHDYTPSDRFGPGGRRDESVSEQKKTDEEKSKSDQDKKEKDEKEKDQKELERNKKKQQNEMEQAQGEAAFKAAYDAWEAGGKEGPAPQRSRFMPQGN